MNKTHILFVIGCLFLRTTCYAQQAQPPSAPPVSSQEPRLITIPEGIRLVMKDSRLLKISLADKDMVFADSLMARSVLLPQLNATVNESFLKFQPTAKSGGTRMPTGERQSISYGFDVYQTLFDFGKAISNYRAAQELFNAGILNTERVRKLAVLEFVIAYFDVLQAEKLIQVAQKEAESLTAYLHDVEHLYEQGVAIKNDLLPAQVRLADAKQKLIVARNIRETSTAKLNNIMGLPIREKLRVEDIQMSAPSVPELEDAWHTAQAQRPEITIISDQLKASALREKSKIAGNYPTLYARGGYAYTENIYQVHQDNMNLNLGAKMDVFDGGFTQAEVYKERSRHKGLQEQRDKLIEDIKLEIEDSYLGLNDAKEKVAVARDALKQAEENVRVMRVKYAEGEATSTDVLEAITLQTNAQTNYHNADYELKRNYAKLMYSMGIDLALIYDTIKLNEDKSKQ